MRSLETAWCWRSTSSIDAHHAREVELVACCMGDNRVRFERELHRLRGYRFKRLLIVGSEKDIREHRR